MTNIIMFIIIVVLCFTTPLVILGQATNRLDEVRVQTDQGTIVGFIAEDGDYFAFHSIRYAGDVSGANRFRAAPPPPKFKEEFRAYDRDIICAQPSPQGVVGVEDCLTLNIFTSNVTGTRPVYVWINGEEYSRTYDTPRYSFKSLVEDGLVFVALNYRLSIFGFLCLGVEEAPGNAGLKDVIQALQWVNANIAAFGGDPNNVILMGHGSGAAMVDLITISPQSENLVHKAVAISGSGIAPWAVAFDPLGYAKALAAKVYINVDTNQELAQLLVSINVDSLVNAINEFEFTNNSILFAPCVENANLKGSILEDAPINLIKAAKYPHIPYLAIYASEEGTARAAQAIDGRWLEGMQQNFMNFLPVDLKFSHMLEKGYMGEIIRNYYFGFRPVTQQSIRSFLDYQSDTLTKISVIRGVRERAAAEFKAVQGQIHQIYLVEFDFIELPDPDWPFPEVPVNGTRHGDILKYIFDLSSANINDLATKILHNRLIAFAETGVPIMDFNKDSNDTSGTTTFSPVTIERLSYLSLSGRQWQGGSSSRENGDRDPLSRTMEFWDEQVSQHYAAPGRVPVYPDDSPNKASALSVGLVLITCLFLVTTLYRF